MAADARIGGESGVAVVTDQASSAADHPLDLCWAGGTAGAARSLLIVLAAGVGLAACATGAGYSPPAAGGGGRAHGTDAPYQVGGRWYYPHAQPNYDMVGIASWYGEPFHNRRTADGELFDQNAPSAAHTTLPLPSMVEVTNLANGRRARVRLNDRGPFVDGRILDLSRAAAAELGFEREGVARVRVRYIGPAPPLAVSGVMVAVAAPPPLSLPPSPARPRPAPARPVEIAGSEPPPATLSVAPPVALALPPPVDPPAELPADATATPPSLEPPLPLPAASPVEPLAAPPAALSPAAVAPGGYRVQAGAFQSRAAAERAAAQLSDAGATSIQPIQRDGVTLYRVVVGGFPDEEAAAQGLVRVLDAGFDGARVIGGD